MSTTMNHELMISLSTPITAHGEEIDHLTLRQPTTGDLIELGQPMRLLPGNGLDEPAIDIRMNVVAHYVARLAAIPLSSVKALSLADFGKATQVVLGFFVDGGTISPSPSVSSNSPGSSKPLHAKS